MLQLEQAKTQWYRMFNYPHPFFELVKAANQNCFDVNSNQTSEKTKTTFSVMVIRLTCIDLH